MMKALFPLTFLIFSFVEVQTACSQPRDSQVKRDSMSGAKEDKLSAEKKVRDWSTSPVQINVKNLTGSPYHLQWRGEGDGLTGDICAGDIPSCNFENTKEYPEGPSSDPDRFTVYISECCGQTLHVKFWAWQSYDNRNVLVCERNDDIPESYPPILNYTLHWGDDLPSNCTHGEEKFCCTPF